MFVGKYPKEEEIIRFSFIYQTIRHVLKEAPMNFGAVHLAGIFIRFTLVN
jgi:hypothetical protein